MSETLATLRRPVILIVEDDDHVRSITARLLQSAGFAVLTAVTPTEALEIASTRSDAIDLLLADVGLPGMSGGILALELSALRPGLRSLLCSGHPREVLMQQGKLEADALFLAKPFRLNELLEKVRQILGG